MADTCGSLYIPDGLEANAAIQRVTHLSIGAHQDDCEFMSFHGIIQCYDKADKWFAACVTTNGGGSPRCGDFAQFTNEQIQAERLKEQNKAADIGQYACMWQLGFESSVVKDAANRQLELELVKILKQAKPDVVYTHNLLDKHDTHIATVLAFFRAIRSLPSEERPRQVIGCEMWRDLDWLNDEDRLVLDVSGFDQLADELNGVFVSQISGGKAYEKAIIGRRTAHATFFDTHSLDFAQRLTFAYDMTPLILDDSIDLIAFACEKIDNFKANAVDRLQRLQQH